MASIQELLRSARWVHYNGNTFENPEYQKMLQAAQMIDELQNETAKMREALEPFASLFLYPDDFGDYTAKLIKEDEDWDEKKSDDTDEEVFVKRKWIKDARFAMKKDDEQ